MWVGAITAEVRKEHQTAALAGPARWWLVTLVDDRRQHDAAPRHEPARTKAARSHVAGHRAPGVKPLSSQARHSTLVGAPQGYVVKGLGLPGLGPVGALLTMGGLHDRCGGHTSRPSSASTRTVCALAIPESTRPAVAAPDLPDPPEPVDSGQTSPAHFPHPGHPWPGQRWQSTARGHRRQTTPSPGTPGRSSAAGALYMSSGTENRPVGLR